MPDTDHMPHPHDRRSRFDRFAERAAEVSSGAPFAVVCAFCIVVWIPSLWLTSPESAQFFLQTMIAVVTFLLVALLQNSQKRSEEAVNLKLNAIAEAIADLMRERAGEDKDLTDNIEKLTHTVGLEHRVTRTPNSANGT